MASKAAKASSRKTKVTDTGAASSSGSTAKPSLRLLFSFLSARDVVIFLLPAIASSIAVGMVPTAMSKVVGNAFDAFTSYGRDLATATQPASDLNRHFLDRILVSVYALLGLSAAMLVISTLSVSAWICLGERAAARLRFAVFHSLIGKRMAWFDTGMGLSSDQDDEEREDKVDISPAGLMTKVARECDDLRVALSREAGDVTQHLTTAIASLVLALYTSWSLTLVVLASIPVVLVLTIVTELGANPWLQRERTSTAQATSMVEGVVAAINTVKAFNAQSRETARFEAELSRGGRAYRRMLLWWASRFGITGALVFATFVQGFWFGAHLVSKHKLSPGQVMTVFMSSLLVSGTLNEIVQALSYIDKGKVGAANLVNLIHSSDDDRRPPPKRASRTSSLHSTGSLPSDEKLRASVATGGKSSSGSNSELTSVEKVDILEYDVSRARAVPMSIEHIPTTPSPGIRSPDKFTYRPRPYAYASRARRGVQGLRRIAPTSCQGEVHLRSVSFSYPSRPEACVLRSVDLYFPPAEMTYVVGGSGSGKSTIAHLLLRLYEPTAGTIQIDDQTIEFLDPHWCRQHIGSVSQDPSIFDMSVHDNIALGLVGTSSTSATEASAIPSVRREDIESACRVALLHEFVRDLPDGYDTMLGTHGTTLSGGQRQRLAIARAKLRDPSILILDEATSALDPTTRHLVHQALKTWRRGKTTIVITHDLSQIEPDDFLYLLQDGEVAQQGYRSDLEAKDGPLRSMSMQQLRNAQQCEAQGEEEEQVEQVVTVERAEVEPSRRRRIKYRSMLGWERDAGVLSEHLSLIISQKLEGTPSHLKPLRLAERQAMHTYFEDAEALRASGSTASDRRARAPPLERRRWDSSASTTAVETAILTDAGAAPSEDEAARVATLRQAWRILWRTIPSRGVLVVGLVLCVMAGTLTPIFSYLLAQLVSTMGRAEQQGAVMKWSLLVLLVAVLEGVFGFTRYLVMETLADRWLARLRGASYRNVVAQDRAWFDRGENSAGRICTSIVKDGEDARGLVGQLLGQLALIGSMITLGIVWALVVGWKLTLAGVAFGPVFLAATFAQSRVISIYEARNKLKREAVSERLHAALLHARAIRAMGLESVFSQLHQHALDEAQRCGMRASVFSGFGHGLSDALTYVAEALIFYVGARLIVSGEYDFARMMQVFNLIIFAVTFAAQMLTCLPGLSKSIKALTDLDRLVRLADSHAQSSETAGEQTCDVRGQLEFRNVGFSYPGRSQGRVLDGLQFSVGAGECVAIVGASGCGKSTVASLLQRLYEPTEGEILIDGVATSCLSTAWLREHISIVGQTPSLFDLSIAANIAYGANAKLYTPPPTETSLSPAELELVQHSARAANADGFIQALPQGYATSVGNKLSGGQAQRVAIARALMRVRARILILDECTSALDPTNQHLIVQTLLDPNAELRARRMTTLVITHNIDMMRRCDRIIVLRNGKVAEHGSFHNLIATPAGYFASLARAGEWIG